MLVPKVVDHEQRRQAIAEAVRRIAADRGLEAVSLGEVAAEAGMSKGLVQHYFSTKDEMLRHATTTLRRQVQQRMPAESVSLRGVLLAMLPVDAEARTEALVANAFLPRALKDPEIGDRFRQGHDELRGAVTALVEAAQQEGTIDPALDPTSEAELLLALTGGLGDAVLLGQHGPDHAAALLDRHLNRLAPRR